MLKTVASVVNFSAEERSLAFHIYEDRRIPQSLSGDEQRLSQVITNLLINAVKFTSEGGEICLKTFLVTSTDRSEAEGGSPLESEDEGGCEIRFEVIDTGIGIAPEQQAELFQPFRQAENNTSRKYGGMGLGLTLSKHIVERNRMHEMDGRETARTIRSPGQALGL